MTRDSVAKPGHTVNYSIWVWSTVPSRQVTATIASGGHAIDKPKFTLCPTRHRRTCWIGSLPAYQAIEMMVKDHVRKKAKPGEQITLTVVVQGVSRSASGGALSPANAVVSTVLNQPNSSSTLPPGTGSFPTGAPGLPGTTVSPGSVSSLFPTITPSTSPPARSRNEKRKPTKATSTASSLPLDPRLIGGQLAGLAVLAAAITMVVARLSLRTPLASAPQSGQAVAAAPPPPQPSASEAETETAKTETDTASES